MRTNRNPSIPVIAAVLACTFTSVKGAIIADPGFDNASSVGTVSTGADNNGMRADSNGIRLSNGVDIGGNFDQWSYSAANPYYIHNGTGGNGGGGAMKLDGDTQNASFVRAIPMASRDNRATTGSYDFSVDINPATLGTSLSFTFTLVGYDDDETTFPTFSNRGNLVAGSATTLFSTTITQTDLTAGAGAYTKVSLAAGVSLADAATDADGDGDGFQNYLWFIEGRAQGANDNVYFDNFTAVIPEPSSGMMILLGGLVCIAGTRIRRKR